MVAIGKAGGVCSLFHPEEDEQRGPPRRLETGLERILFIPFHSETIPLGVFSHPDQPVGLLSFSMDATPVYKEKDS